MRQKIGRSISGQTVKKAMKAFSAFLETLDLEDGRALLENWPIALRGLAKAATATGTIVLEILEEDRKPLGEGYVWDPEWREGTVGRGRFSFASVLGVEEQRITDHDFFSRAEEVGADGTLMDAYALLRICETIPIQFQQIRFVFTDARIIDTEFGTKQVATIRYLEGEWQLHWMLTPWPGKNFTDDDRPVRFK